MGLAVVGLLVEEAEAVDVVGFFSIRGFADEELA